jgi:mannose-6-phosphate isomerase class I
VASGPRTAAERQQLKELFLSRKLGSDVENWPEETRQLLGLIEPLKGGEVFYLPSGTIHTMFAIGPESCLVVDEIQQGYGRSLLPTLSKVLVVQDDLLSIQVHPAMHAIKSLASGELRINQDLDSNPTVRLYDFGRRSGENPELGLELANVPGGFRRLAPVSVSSFPGTMLEIMVACEHFVRTRQTISRGAVAKLQPVYDSYRVLHCAEGVCSVECSSRQWRLSTGETAFVPAELEPELTIRAESECWLFDDAVPDLDVLRAFLTKSGATPCDIDAVANPL